MQAVAITTAKIASLRISELIVELIVSAVIFSSSTPKFSASAAFIVSLSSTESVLVLIITSLVPLTFCACTLPSPVTSSITGITFSSISSIVISSLKVMLVEVPPLNSRL